LASVHKKDEKRRCHVLLKIFEIISFGLRKKELIQNINLGDKLAGFQL
jgi:hypothetical protein